MMSEIRCSLLIRLDEDGQRFIFALHKKEGQYSAETADFTIEMPFEELKRRGADGAEKLVGESVLGFFDRLTNGRLDLPRHYQD